MQLRDAVLTRARAFSLSYWRQKDRDSEYPDDFVRAFAAEGWLGATIPREYGGAGLGMLEAGLILGSICRSGAGTSGASPIHFFMFPTAPIVKFGSER
jgi:alkylation response protein AidB-like acyl-CoA dehydrogenase